MFIKKGGKTEGEPARVRREGRDVWRQTPKTQPQERKKEEEPQQEENVVDGQEHSLLHLKLNGTLHRLSEIVWNQQRGDWDRAQATCTGAHQQEGVHGREEC